MPSSNPLFPQVLWAQRKENVFLTVEVQDAQDLQIDLEEESLKFHAKSGENIYEFALTFPEKINKDKSKWSSNRLVHILLEKAEARRWSKLDVDKSKAHWLKCDWDKWVDTDEEESAGKNRGGGGGGPMDWSSMMGGNDMDFSSMMGGDGMGGMGGMGGMDGMDGMDDDDEDISDEDDEALDGVDDPVGADVEINGTTENVPHVSGSSVPTDAKEVDNNVPVENVV